MPDPWDATPDNPNHRWSITYTQQQLSSALSNAGFGVGTLSSVITPPPHGVSGRVGRVVDANQGGVTLVGDGGTRRVSGPDLRSALGLKSTFFRVAVATVPKHPNGAILQSPSSRAVWVMREGRRWPVANPDAYTSRASWSEISPVPDSVMASYPVAGAGFREGSLLATPDGKVWVVSDGRRRHIANWEVFTGLGLNSSAVRSVSHLVAGADPEGVPVTSAQRVPNGLFVKKSDDPTTYLVASGRARPLASSAALTSYRAGPSEVATISPTQLATLGIGPPAGFRDGSLVATDRVWAIADGTRRWVSSAQAFAALGYDWADVVAVTAQVAAVHPEGPSLDGPPHPNGAIVRASSGPTVWIVKQGIREPVGSEALRSRAAVEETVVTSDQVLAALPTLALGWRDGSLVSAGGKVFLVSNGQRRHVSDPAVFSALGLSWSNVRTVSPTDAAVHPEGQPITSGSRLVDGMFALAGSSTIYQVSGGEARPVVSWEAFMSWRVGTDEVVRVGADKLPPTGAPIAFRDGSLIATDRVWAIADGTRRWVSSARAFAALGYDWADVVAVTTQVANTHAQGPPIT